MSKKRLLILSGFFCWLIFLSMKIPANPYKTEFVEVLIMLAPLLLIPVILAKLIPVKINLIHVLIAAASLGISFIMEAGMAAALCAIPWFLLLSLLLIKTLVEFFTQKTLRLKDLLIAGAFLFLSIGGLWAIVHRLGINPLGFDDTIVLLTVAHFHYAGFILPVLAHLAIKQDDHWSAALCGTGILIGTPLVALGITFSQQGLPIVFETVAASIMALSAFGIGFIQICLGLKEQGRISKGLFLLSGFSLMLGMILAACYGLRPFINLPFLSIPFMYAVHGSLNTFGFALPGILAWVSKQN